MILICSFPGMYKEYIDFTKLIKNPDQSMQEKLKAMSVARGEVIANMRPDLPCDQIIKAVDNYIPFLLELGPLLSIAKCKPVKFSWITAILKSEDKITAQGSSKIK